MRKTDKIGYRYPRGESYFDLIARIDPLMHELESYKEPILIIAHQVGTEILNPKKPKP
jgi:broad specificity phosphatase PhoE